MYSFTTGHIYILYLWCICVNSIYGPSMYILFMVHLCILYLWCIYAYFIYGLMGLAATGGPNVLYTRYIIPALQLCRLESSAKSKNACMHPLAIEVPKKLLLSRDWTCNLQVKPALHLSYQSQIKGVYKKCSLRVLNLRVTHIFIIHMGIQIYLRLATLLKVRRLINLNF